MSIRMINEDLDPNKQTNFYDGMQLDVDDLEQLQIFLNTKIERGVENIAFDGVVEGLDVSQDSVIAEPFEFPTVAQPSTNPNLQNFRDFPEDILDTSDVRMYQVFKANANNTQRFDLKLQLIEGTGTSTLVVVTLSELYRCTPVLHPAIVIPIRHLLELSRPILIEHLWIPAINFSETGMVTAFFTLGISKRNSSSSTRGSSILLLLPLKMIVSSCIVAVSSSPLHDFRKLISSFPLTPPLKSVAKGAVIPTTSS